MCIWYDSFANALSTRHQNAKDKTQTETSKQMHTKRLKCLIERTNKSIVIYSNAYLYRFGWLKFVWCVCVCFWWTKCVSDEKSLYCEWSGLKQIVVLISIFSAIWLDFDRFSLNSLDFVHFRSIQFNVGPILCTFGRFSSTSVESFDVCLEWVINAVDLWWLKTSWLYRLVYKKKTTSNAHKVQLESRTHTYSIYAVAVAAAIVKQNKKQSKRFLCTI